jgi:type II secretory ATPase GspE/PulE/Tfp pilus assembly ATPase PilB-like protein
MGKEKKKIGEILLEEGLIDQFQLNSAIGNQKRWGGMIVTVLINLGFVDEQAVASVLEKQLGIKCIDLEGKDIPPEVTKKIKPEIADKYLIMPLEFDEKTLTLAMSDPTDLKTIDELSFMLGVTIKPLLSFESSIKKAIAKHYQGITYKESYKYRADTEKMSSEMDIIRADNREQDLDFSNDVLLQALIDILFDKNIVSKEDLIKQIRKKLKQKK